MLSEANKATIMDTLGVDAVPFLADFNHAPSVRLKSSDLEALMNAVRAEEISRAEEVIANLRFFIDRDLEYSGDAIVVKTGMRHGDLIGRVRQIREHLAKYAVNSRGS